MTVTARKPGTETLLAEIKELKIANAQLQQAVREAHSDRDMAYAQLAGNIPAATAWLQSKVWSQARELRHRSIAAYTRRLVLRAYAEAGYKLSDVQWSVIRADVADQRLQQALPKTAPTGLEE